MNKKQKNIIEQIKLRAGLNHGQIEDIGVAMASTAGPVIISTLIALGFEVFDKSKKNKKSVKK